MILSAVQEEIIGIKWVNWQEEDGIEDLDKYTEDLQLTRACLGDDIFS